jgi:hypothetical protein
MVKIHIKKTFRSFVPFRENITYVSNVADRVDMKSCFVIFSVIAQMLSRK